MTFSSIINMFPINQSYFLGLIIACLKTIKKGGFMTYIIENANILKESELVTTSLLVKENKIAYISNNFRKYSFTRMNAEPYIMTPTYVIFDSLANMKSSSFEGKKDYFLKKFIMQGCTTLLTYVNIKYDHEVSSKIKSTKLELINSPIDYLIGIKVPLRLLTPSLIRKCKKEKIPAVFIEFNEMDNLSNIPWGWIREAMFPFNSPLIPYINESDQRKSKKLLLDWNEIMLSQKINHIEAPLLENVPLQLRVLSKLGVFPHKSSILQGGELSYNLYRKNRDIKKVDVDSLFQYHNDRLLVTVHKGVVIRASEAGILFRSGFGEHVTVKLPAFFSIS
jgi:hypothetical protein